MNTPEQGECNYTYPFSELECTLEGSELEAYRLGRIQAIIASLSCNLKQAFIEYLRLREVFKNSGINTDLEYQSQYDLTALLMEFMRSK